MSAINTNGINVNYPTPGVNNSTQGFRDNFASIKNNLDTSKTEITDIQSKVVVKSGLNGVTLNNDMANTLISNALVRSFRASTYPLGNDLSGTVIVDISKGDVQYGTIVADTTINFGGWAPRNTQSNVQLNLTIANSAAVIHFPDSSYQSQVLISGMTDSVEQLENYGVTSTINGQNETLTNQITAPAGASEIQLKFSTIDCGTTIDVYPLNRNQSASRISLRTPTNQGALGDTAGAICTDGTNLYLCVGDYDGSSIIWGQVGDLLSIGTITPHYTTAPENAVSPGTVGQIAISNDGAYLFMCVAVNTWVRTPLETNW